MNYTIKDFKTIYGITGISEKAIDAHLTLYEGYVKNTNVFIQILKQTENGTPQYNEIKRRFSFEWNGMRMHEIFFSNLTKDVNTLDSESLLFKEIVLQFESYESWLEDFIATGSLRGPGWVALIQDRSTGKLMNVWIDEHHIGQYCDSNILLLIDGWEHAYMLDYGTKKSDYLKAVIGAVDWREVVGRFEIKI